MPFRNNGPARNKIKLHTNKYLSWKKHKFQFGIQIIKVQQLLWVNYKTIVKAQPYFDIQVIWASSILECL